MCQTRKARRDTHLEPKRQNLRAPQRRGQAELDAALLHDHALLAEREPHGDAGAEPVVWEERDAGVVRFVAADDEVWGAAAAAGVPAGHLALRAEEASRNSGDGIRDRCWAESDYFFSCERIDGVAAHGLRPVRDCCLHQPGLSVVAVFVVLLRSPPFELVLIATQKISEGGVNRGETY